MSWFLFTHPQDLGSVSEALLSITHQSRDQLQQVANETTTESYCAPELMSVGGTFQDETVDTRVDIWSLGCCLYAGAFKMNPFDNEVSRGGSLKLAINNAKFSFPSKHPYSKGLIQLITSLVVREPSKRPLIDSVISVIQTLLTGGNPNPKIQILEFDDD